MLKRSVQSLWGIFFKKFNSVSHVLKRSSILWVFSKKVNFLSDVFEQTHFFDSNRKNSIPRVTKKVWLLESKNLFGSNSLSPFVQRVQSIESNSRKGSILWVKFLKSSSILWVLLKRVQICKFYWKIFKYWKSSILRVKMRIGFQLILWVMFNKKFNSFNHVQQKNQFFQSCSTKSSIFRVMFRKRFNSLSHVQKGSISMSHVEMMGSIPWVTWKKISVLWVMFFKKKKSVSHFSETILRVIYFFKKDWILWRISKRKFKSSSHLLKKVQFSECCASYFTRKNQFFEW